MLNAPGSLPLPTKTERATPSTPALSVIAPCYNEEAGDRDLRGPNDRRRPIGGG